MNEEDEFENENENENEFEFESQVGDEEESFDSKSYSDIQPDRFNSLNANPKVTEEIINTKLAKPDYKKYKEQDSNANTVLGISTAVGAGMLAIGAILGGLASAGILGASFVFPPAAIALIVLAGIASVGGMIYGAVTKYKANKHSKVLEKKERNLQEKSLEAKIDVIENSRERLNSAAKVHIEANKNNSRNLDLLPKVKNVPLNKINPYLTSKRLFQSSKKPIYLNRTREK
jgi:hypothetical protein